MVSTTWGRLNFLSWHRKCKTSAGPCSGGSLCGRSPPMRQWTLGTCVRLLRGLSHLRFVVKDFFFPEVHYYLHSFTLAPCGSGCTQRGLVSTSPHRWLWFGAADFFVKGFKILRYLCVCKQVVMGGGRFQLWLKRVISVLRAAMLLV